MTGTSSVLNLCLTSVSAMSILTPDECISLPSQAIIAPLSMQNLRSGTNISAPLSAAISATISLRRRFWATPPPRRTSSLTVWAIALSVTSASMAKQVSWIENAMSSRRCPFFFSAKAAVIIPENEMSMPFTEYGNSRSLSPSFASFSMVGPA